MVSPKREFGDLGEALASKYLIERGYKIIGSNYLKPWGEIDLITKKGDQIVFFEVKTRDSKNVTHFSPEQSVNSSKKRKLQKTCETYLLERSFPQDQEWQIDVLALSIEKESGMFHVEHFENVVWESRY